MVQLVVHHAQGVERLEIIRTREVPCSNKLDTSVSTVTVLQTERPGFDLHEGQGMTATMFTCLIRTLGFIPVS
jgi:hypothetical protein